MARHGELAAIERVVVNDPPFVDSTDELYKTAMMTASADGRLDAIAMLLDNGSVFCNAFSHHLVFIFSVA